MRRAFLFIFHRTFHSLYSRAQQSSFRDDCSMLVGYGKWVCLPMAFHVSKSTCLFFTKQDSSHWPWWVTKMIFKTPSAIHLIHFSIFLNVDNKARCFLRLFKPLILKIQFWFSRASISTEVNFSQFWNVEVKDQDVGRFDISWVSLLSCK